MFGGAGDDTYFFDGSDGVVENANEGIDTVLSTTHYALSPNVETLVLQGSADLQGYGNNLANRLDGNTGNNLLNGGVGADVMVGGAGSDAYFVDDPGDTVVENAGEGTDAVFSTVNYVLAANVETLVLQGLSNLTATGNALGNQIFGNSGDNTLDGGAGTDVLTGGATPWCSIWVKATATLSSTLPGTARGRGIRCSSSATARARPSPTSMRRIGGSTSTPARRKSSPS